MCQNLDHNSPKVRSLLLEVTSDSKQPSIPLETSIYSTQPANISEHQQETSTVPSDSPENYLTDLESKDDDVIFLGSSRGFPKGRNHSSRKQSMIVILDEDSEDTSTKLSVDKAFRSSFNSPNKRNRSLPIRTVVNNDLHHLEEHNEKQRNVLKSDLESEKVALKEHASTCVVCTNPLLQPSSTICGHIFCLRCIRAFIQERKKCPICAKKLTNNDFHRVYLPVSEY